MNPILFSKNATNFTTNGLGRLNVIECIVEEARNDIYEARFSMYKNERHFDLIEILSIVVIKVSDGTMQPFVVYKIEKETEEICIVYCEHISYKLRGVPVIPFQANSASAAMSGIKTNSVITNPFTFYSNVTTNATFNPQVPASARSLLGGMEGSVLDKFGGEFKFDNFNVSLLANRGSDRGVTLRYGKNIMDFSDEVDTEDTTTGILPYWTNGEYLVVGDISYTNNQLTPLNNIVVEDVSQDFSDVEYSDDKQGVPSHPTKAEVTERGREHLKTKEYPGVVRENLKISFVKLSDTEEYKNIAPLETVQLCDLVTVIYEPYDFSLKMKVTKTEWDAIEERYESIELGDVRPSLSMEILQRETDLEKAIRLLNDSNSRIKKRFEVVEDGLEFEVSTRTEEGEDIYAELDLRILNEEGDGGDELISMINGHADRIHFQANKFFTVDAPNWSVKQDGTMYIVGSLKGKVYDNEQYPLKNIIVFNPMGGGVEVYCDVLEVNEKIDTEFLNAKVLSATATGFFSGDGYDGNDCAIEVSGSGMLANRIKVTDSATFETSIDVSGVNSQGQQMNTQIGRYVHTKSVELTDPEAVTSAPNCVIGNTGYLCINKNASSKRWKNSITKKLSMNPQKLYELPVVQFKYNKDYLSNEKDSRYDKPLIGFIAEDMDKVFPQAVDYDEEGKPNGWNEHYLIPAMMKLIQEQNERIKNLEKEVFKK